MSAYQERFVEVHGVRTHILYGGKGPDLVYWHGAGNGGGWLPHHALLAEHFTVYAPDHPGWGASDNPDWMDSFHDYTLHNDALLTALGLERPLLVGHSLGGWMASEFAVTYPNRLAALVLVNSAGMPFTEESVPDFFAVVARGGEALAKMLFHKMDVATTYLSPNPTPEERILAYRALTSTARLAWNRWFDEKLPRRLARIQCPSLVLWGAQERLFPPSLGQRFAEAIPNAEIRLFEDCGHMLPMESPEAFVEAIVRFASERGLA